MFFFSWFPSFFPSCHCRSRFYIYIYILHQFFVCFDLCVHVIHTTLPAITEWDHFCSPDWRLFLTSGKKSEDWMTTGWLVIACSHWFLLNFPRPCIWCTELWRGSLSPCPYHLPWFHPPRGKNPLCLPWCRCYPRPHQSKTVAPPTLPLRPCPTPLNLPQLLPQHQLLPLWVLDPFILCSQHLWFLLPNSCSQQLEWFQTG